MSKVSINLLTFNAEKYLDACMESVRCQSFCDFKILAIDNGSKDGTREKIDAWRKIFEGEGIEFKTIYNEKNVGFAEGHNVGFKFQITNFKFQNNDQISNLKFQKLPSSSSLVKEGNMEISGAVSLPAQAGTRDCGVCDGTPQSSFRDCDGEKNLTRPLAHSQEGEKLQYVCCLNQDAILRPDYLEKLIDFMDARPDCGAASGKLMRILDDKLFFTVLIDATHTLTPSRVRQDGAISGNGCLIDYKRLVLECKSIDSMGIRIFKSHRAVDIGQSEEDNGQYDEVKEVFGVPGTLPVFRVEALEDIKMRKDEYFDKDFESYKEDVDLTYRLRWRGWKIFVVPDAVAYHKRGARQLNTKLGDFTTAFNRKNKPRHINYLSQRNQIWMLVKNVDKLNFATLWYEAKKVVYEMLFEWPTFKAWFDIWKKIGVMRGKRKWIMENRKVGMGEIRKWYE